MTDNHNNRLLSQIRVASANAQKAREKSLHADQELENLIWQAQAAGITVTVLAEASGMTRQMLYNRFRKSTKATRNARVREYMRTVRGMDVTNKGAIAASIQQDYDNWINNTRIDEENTA